LTLKEKLNGDFISAMKEKDDVRKSTISFVRAAIKQYEKDNQADADDEVVTQILTKQVKMRKDALSDFEKAGRTDLYNAYNDEISVLTKYLPEQMSEEDIKSIVLSTMEELGIEDDTSNMGKLMGAVMSKVKGKADGNLVKQVVSQTLSR
jgi:uncharacterized protein YqeY